MLCLVFYLELSQKPIAYNRLSRKALIWYIEVFTDVQYGDQMCIIYVHNHKWGDSFFSHFINFSCLLGSSYHSKVRRPQIVFIPESSLNYENLKILLHIHAIPVPGGPFAHNLNIFSRSNQKEVNQSNFHILTWFFSYVSAPFYF